MHTVACLHRSGWNENYKTASTVKFVMDPQYDSHVSENGELGGLSEVCNGSISGRIEDFNWNNISDVLQSKTGHHGDVHASKITELMNSSNLENASMHSLFGVVNKILNESIERNGDITQRVASVLKLVVQEIEHRVSKHADNMRKGIMQQSNLYKSREDRYHTMIRALESLAAGTSEENEIVMNQLQKMKAEKTKIEEEKKLEQQNLIKLKKEKDCCVSQILSLNEELALAKKSYEEDLFQLEAKAEDAKEKLQNKILELECLLADSSKKVKELEEFSNSKFLRWKRKEQGYRHFIDSQSGSIQELRSASESIKEEVSKIKDSYAEEFYRFGLNLKGLIDAAQSYHSVLEENRKLYNEVQDLKGNIRVYCRIRPFLPGQNRKQTTIQCIGDNGELVVINPSKPGKDSHRLFKFNKVFSPAATQEDVFRDTQPLIRSILDGYNVCIFAYGQTGSGKTYTMTGPNVSSVVDWGVNYRALYDLFNISQTRRSSIEYEICVQMVEIYNEQVELLIVFFDLRTLGIWSTSQPNGLAVPDASLHPVKSTIDVLELMNVGLTNRAVGATALNERSSRSHSILTVHVRGLDLETSAVLRGCLHLVDLAGSERVDRSEATGDRLREAQHINKSLSALGDVIFALAQKSTHVPYRNSKLTQVLQSSLVLIDLTILRPHASLLAYVAGGQAKTLMFVQLNPDVESFSETISTLKFAERVSGVELGAARSNKESRGVRELMEQVASLKDAVAKKDEEIEQLQSHKTNGSTERLVDLKSAGKVASDRAASDPDNSSEYSDKHSEVGSHQSMDELKHHKDFFRQSRLAAVGGEKFPEDNGLKLEVAGQNGWNEDVELLGLGDGDLDDRLSDISDGVLSMRTETDCSINSIVEHSLFPETTKPPPEIIEKPNVPAKIPRPPKLGPALTSRPSLSKSTSKIPSSKKATPSSSSSALKPPKRWQ
ncbi:P-loop nucleoside triphosphate hydrolasessuperfamily protein with CH (Calponin Homology) domain [Striga asiatica]|uniref:P-loop nucleoside triphosphate hydrolasessuperfamily protein with CH (Calponin Homology) domain n=1 Tax=Striga asiatica TaxID=4170 RepID=A0A5A7RK54_STRAF|nr:P-loop nucleoside triphosphate hydrolasessuperfamily protein with CH (Calponin Homology) domain [Striga asiatica]